jgi:hypothetical protein
VYRGPAVGRRRRTANVARRAVWRQLNERTKCERHEHFLHIYYGRGRGRYGNADTRTLCGDSGQVVADFSVYARW